MSFLFSRCVWLGYAIINYIQINNDPRLLAEVVFNAVYDNINHTYVYIKIYTYTYIY